MTGSIVDRHVAAAVEEFLTRPRVETNEIISEISIACRGPWRNNIYVLIKRRARVSP